MQLTTAQWQTPPRHTHCNCHQIVWHLASFPCLPLLVQGMGMEEMSCAAHKTLQEPCQGAYC